MIALRQELTAAGLDAGPPPPARPPAEQRTAGTVKDDDLADLDPRRGWSPPEPRKRPAITASTITRFLGMRTKG